MELASTDLAALGAAELLRVSASIPRAAPRTFALLTACLVFPLSMAVLAHSLFTHPILLRIQGATTSSADLQPQWLPRLLRTFLWVSLLMLAYHLAFGLSVLLLVVVFNLPDDASDSWLSLAFNVSIAVDGAVFFWIHVHVSALWHLASVVSVLEPLRGVAAMAKSRQLLQGRTGAVAESLVAGYLTVCGATSLLFYNAVVQGRDEEGSFGLAWPWRLLAGAVLVCLLVCVNLLGLLVQSVVYYACKAFHNQPIDRTALYEHLGGYLGEYVPLKSDIQIENL